MYITYVHCFVLYITIMYNIIKYITVQYSTAQYILHILHCSWIIRLPVQREYGPIIQGRLLHWNLLNRIMTQRMMYWVITFTCHHSSQGLQLYSESSPHKMLTVVSWIDVLDFSTKILSLSEDESPNDPAFSAPLIVTINRWL